MKQQEIFKKIGIILKELSDQYEYLEMAENHFNELELELFVANVNFLNDHIEILYKLNLQNNSQQQNLESTEPKYFEPVVQAKQAEQLKEDEPVISAIPETKINEDQSFEEKPAIISEIAQDLTPKDSAFIWANSESSDTETAIEEAQTSYLDHEKQFEEILSHIKPATQAQNADQQPWGNIPEPDYRNPQVNEFSSSSNLVKEEPFVEEPAAIIPDESVQVTEEPAGPPLSDIKQGITLNDKLLFVKELFNGYNLAYSEAIEILNRFSNFEEANRFLNTNYVNKNNWAGRPDTTAKFYALLKRRYS